MNSKNIDFLKKEFAFDAHHAKKFISDFHSEMKSGLEGQASSLKMISSFVKPASGNETGDFLALDLGGTNFRVMAIELSGKRKFKILSASKFSIPKELMTGVGEQLFDFIASSLDSFLTANKLSRNNKYALGFTFSFPVRQTGIKSGSLIQWTKGFSASGVEGKDVVKLLQDAIARHGLDCISVEALANDTVGTLVTKSYEVENCAMGVILGTGTNACYPEKSRDGIIVNMEWGNFNKFPLTRFDKMLDDESNNKGKQLFEKAVSGMYIGEIFRMAIADKSKAPYSITGENLAEMSSGKDENAVITNIIAERSAKLAASAVASVLLWQGDWVSKERIVAIDGSLYEKFPGYKQTTISFLKEILGEKSGQVHFELAKDGSGVGAAMIAAIASLHHLP